jgi:hypothetical protein
MQALINKDVSRFLEEFIKEGTDTKEGIVWVLPNVELKDYANIALKFDKIVCESGGTVYSTNIVPPEDFSHSEVRDHLSELNENLLRKFLSELKSKGNSSGKSQEPPLLRLQIVNEKGNNGSYKLPLNIIDKKAFFKTIGDDYKKFYVTPYTFVITPTAKGVVPKRIFGDYIVYNNSVILKWDADTHTLYLLFGKRLVDLYLEIFKGVIDNLETPKKWEENGIINLCKELFEGTGSEYCKTCPWKGSYCKGDSKTQKKGNN